MVFTLVVHASLCVCTNSHPLKDNFNGGNDVASSPTSMWVSYSTLIFVNVCIYIDCRVFDPVTYQSALYLVVGASIGYMVIPCLQEEG